MFFSTHMQAFFSSSLLSWVGVPQYISYDPALLNARHMHFDVPVAGSTGKTPRVKDSWKQYEQASSGVPKFTASASASVVATSTLSCFLVSSGPSSSYFGCWFLCKSAAAMNGKTKLRMDSD